MAAGNVLACLAKPILQVDLIPVVALAMHRFRQLQSLRKETEELRRMVSETDGTATDSQPRRAE
jgi:AmiR/NasT family two-component response regulator